MGRVKIFFAAIQTKYIVHLKSILLQTFTSFNEILNLNKARTIVALTCLDHK